MANKKFEDYVLAGDNITLTYDNNADTVTIDAAGNVDSVNGQVGVVVLTKTNIGLGNVDNTSDANKPVSTAQQTALNLKQNSLVSGTNIKTVNSNTLLGSGDLVIDKTSVGLGNVANVDTTNASNISSGTLGDARLSSNVTTQGNTFNAANKLVQLDATAKLPAVDGSQLTNLPSFTPPNGLLKIASAISTTFQVVKDYLDNASVLFLNSRRIGIGKDTSVTTQSVAVVEVQDTNTSIVLKPNGTGGIIASVPDGTDAGGGNARGNGAVDLQLSRYNKVQVASGNFSFIGGGANNRATGITSVCVGGDNNFSTGLRSFVGAGTNVSASGQDSVAVGGNTITCAATGATVSGGVSNNIPTSAAAYSTISGGQSNTSSTNTHATVVGGQSNTASGQWAIAGGGSNTASAQGSIAIGYKGIASGLSGIVLANNDGSGNPTANAPWSMVLGSVAGTASERYSSVIGGERGLASAYYSYAFGNRSSAYLRNQLAFAPGRFSETGDAQHSNLTSYKLDTLTTSATTVLSLDGTGTTNLIIPNGNNRAWNVQIDTIAVVTAITGTATGVTVGDCYRETKQLLFKRIGGTSSIVGTVDTSAIKSDSGMSTASITISAGASQQMAITFTGPSFLGGGSVTCRVVSKVSLVECAY
jgi:hypothetical protein